jgi:hypothetical protein
LGLNIPVEISTAAIFRNLPEPPPLVSIVVMAHLDTGAGITSIDIMAAPEETLQTGELRYLMHRKMADIFP